MTENIETKEIAQKIKQTETEVSALKEKLSSLNTEKEAWFAKKGTFSDAIKKNIAEIKELKIKRNELTTKVKTLKRERDELNKEISDNVKVIVKEKKDAGPIPEIKGKKISPGKIKKEIEQIEFKLQTEPMGFEKEQKLRKQIKAQEKILHEFEGQFKATKELREVSNKTSSLKKTANGIHKEIQDVAQESQDIHEKLITKSKEVDDLKEKEEEAYKKFLELKEEFNKLNTELQDKHKVFFESKQKNKETKVQAAKKKAKEDEKTLKEKAKEVEEKITKRKKLTTEDLLIMQRGTK
ncbi:MAG: coiled-coil protein [Candidatus Woesearchaeota archaeon]